MDSLLQDLRFAVRTLRRSPWFTLVSVLTLALGIGVNAAMWSVADAVFLRNLPYEDPAKLVMVWQGSPREERGPLAIPTFQDVRERSRSFQALTILKPVRLNLASSDAEPERVQGIMVSEDVFKVLGREPVVGRGFLPEDHRPGAAPVVILSYETWRQRFGDESALRKTIQLDQQTYQIIGVLPPELGQERIDNVSLGDYWIPIELFRDVLPFEDRSARPGLYALGRLKTVDPSALRADLELLTNQLREEHPSINRDIALQAVELRHYLTQGDRQALFILLGAVALVLFIACANLINLQLSRLKRREQEMATRWALGAERRRLMVQLTIENLLLGLLGSIAGMGLAMAILRGLPYFVVERWWVEAVTLEIWGLALVLGLLAGVLVGWIPALRMIQASRQGRFSKMQMRSSLPNKKLRQVLVGVEVALSLMTLILAGLLTGSVSRLGSEDPGFVSQDRTTFRMVLPQARFAELPSWISFFDNTLSELSNLSGVSAVALTSKGPLADKITESIVAPGDRPLPAVADMSLCLYQMVSPGYFGVLEIPVLEGRDLLPSDDDRLQAEPVVVVSQSLAQAFWPDSSPIGKRLAFEFLGTPSAPEPQWREIVGVVGDVRSRSLRQAPGFAVYTSFRQVPQWFRDGVSPSMTFVAHSQDLPPDEVLKSARKALHRIAPSLPLIRPQTMESTIDTQLEATRRYASLLLVFALLAVVLSVVGVLGVVSYVATARTREMGTRMAMGAAPMDILWIFLKQSMQTIGAGIVLGLLASAGLSRVVSSLLYGLEPVDPFTYLVAAMVLLVLAMLATLFPGLRAARIRPLEALRYE